MLKPDKGKLCYYIVSFLENDIRSDEEKIRMAQLKHVLNKFN